jgi:hypothetical protein
LAITDLHARGLITIQRMDEKFTGDDPVTPLGRAFMRFVEEYVPEAKEDGETA